MRVLICGDRNWRELQPIADCIESLPLDTVIIHGNARGADKMADGLAHYRGLIVLSYPALWNQFGRAAGPIRNQQMLEDGKPDVVAFFHNNLRNSKGTKDMVKISYQRYIPIINGRSVTDWRRVWRLILAVGV